MPSLNLTHSQHSTPIISDALKSIKAEQLSPVTDYYIRKLLQQNVTQLTSIEPLASETFSEHLCCSSIALFDRIRLIYSDVASIVPTLESLVLQHQTLRSDGGKYQLELSCIEEQIFSCFALKRTQVTAQARILIIDDTPDTLRLLTSTLIHQGYAVDQLPNGSSAVDYVRHSQPDLILLDVMMPGVDGYEVCERLKFDEKTNHIPVLFLSGIDDSPNKVKAFELGGVDYVTKPFQIEEVLARIEYQLKLYQLQKQQQAMIEVEQPYKDFFENAIEGMFQTTVSGQYLRVNQALASLLGYDSPEDLMSSIQDLSLHLYTIPQRRSQFILYLEQFGKVKNFEVEVYCKNGDRIWIKETARSVRDSEGNLKYYEGIVQDITQDKHKQHKLDNDQLENDLTDHYKSITISQSL
jgi:adenylate cyclase